MLSQQEIDHIANLARLELSSQERERYRKELSLILDYVSQLQELDVEGVLPMSHSVEIRNVMREDAVRKESAERVNLLRCAAPHQEQGYIKTRPILE